MGQVGQVGREVLLEELGNSDNDEEEVWDLFNELQAEEPTGDMYIWMEASIEVSVRVILHFYIKLNCNYRFTLG